MSEPEASEPASTVGTLPVLLTPAPSASRDRLARLAVPLALAVFGLIDVFVLGLFAHNGDATFAFSQPFAKVTVPNLSLPAAETCYACGALSLVLAVVRVFLAERVWWRRLCLAAVVFLFVVALLAWAAAGQTIAFNVVNLLSNTLNQSIPIMLGALTGVICSRSGVINIAIEGQLLFGAFAAAMVTSASGSLGVGGSLWLGLVCGAFAGSLVGALLAVFAISYRVDQVILGVVLNTLILGLTGYLYDVLMVPYQNTLNSPVTFSLVKIPLLADIPVIGPVFFDSTVFLYLTYVLLAVVQVGLFRTRWGLRTRAVGEHPVAADTVGIRVLRVRYRNVIGAGLIAGIGGAYFTIGSVGSFGKGMSSGEGYIALAAMIFGRYTPFGAIGAALLFGFTTELQSILSSFPGVTISSNLLLMTPYVVTIIVVAGLVGRVRGPRAEGLLYGGP
jgi:simple sugar transport system permease protein